MSNKTKPDEEDVRTEYEALTAYGRQIVTVRYTLFGFFLPTVGLVILRGSPSEGEYLLFCFLTIGLWILELRNRALLIELDDRGMQIENEYWKYDGEKKDDPFISRQHKEGQRYTKVFWRRKKVPCPEIISHRNALDLIYLSVFLYSLLNLEIQLYKRLLNLALQVYKSILIT